MISVLDYGVGNLGSIINMFRRIGVKVHIASSADELQVADKLLLPGVGAFDTGMRRLRESGMYEALCRRVLDDHVPILGICLGMQMLGNGSEEGEESGLGIIDGQAVRFSFRGEMNLKVPHMGWSTLSHCKESRLLASLPDQSRFYFVHSYHFTCHNKSDVLATANYGGEFVAMVCRDNVFGAQFHPEKSHRFGMALLHSFSEL